MPRNTPKLLVVRQIPWLWLLMIPVLSMQASLASAQGLRWVPIGASPNTGGQTENVKPDNEVVGAVNAIAVHPIDPEILYVGAVNGGIWRTADAMKAAPSWTIQTDDHESLSIAALEFDPTDQGHLTLVAGIGGFSSFGTEGELIGILRTVDGTSWKALDGGGVLSGFNISGVAPRGDTIVISVIQANTSVDRGIWRSTDQGANWTRLSGLAASGLPFGKSFDLIGDPQDVNRLYVHAAAAFYRSNDTGATWEKVSDQAVDGFLVNAANVELATGKNHHVYMAIVGGSKQLSAVFRSENGGATWTQMDLPRTSEAGIHPGGQGDIHLSLAVDRDNNKIAYIGGDRQELFNSNNVFINSIGANDYSGRLFRSDATKPTGKQWVHLTHSKDLGPDGGGTANKSAPHADSRCMAMAVNGVLIEGDDGGVYRRTNPKDDSGDWFSSNGNLQTSEYHAIAWDANANVVVAGAQDTGTSEQLLATSPRFKSIATADGGVVAVDDRTTPGRSVRYSSWQELGKFRRRVFNAGNLLLSDTDIPLTPLGGNPPVAPGFYTPFSLNAVDAKRLVIGATNGVYESMNQGDTVRLIGPSIVANEGGLDTVAYGAANNVEAIYVGSKMKVFIRSAARPSPLKASATYPGGVVMSIVMAPNDWKNAFVIDPTEVHQTSDGGATWTNLTANLATLRPRTLRCMAFIPGTTPSLVVGSDKGVFATSLGAAANWTRIGTGLPKVAVYHLEYDAQDDLLIAGTLGRGGWTLLAPAPGSVPEGIQAMLAQAAAAPTAPAPAGLRAVAPVENTTKPIVLRDGVLLDLTSGSVILMQPKKAEKKASAVEAVQIESGQSIWIAEGSDKPLDVSAGRVITQVAMEDLSQLKLSILSVDTGKIVAEGERSLPLGIKASIDESVEGTYLMRASSRSDQSMVTWSFRPRRLRGVRPGAGPDTDSDAESNTPDDSPARVRATSGMFSLDLNTAQMEAVNVGAPGILALDGSEGQTEEVILEGVEGEQFASLDGEHIISSVLTGDDTIFEKYTLSVYEKESKEKIGQLKSHLAFVPLAVVKGQFVAMFEPQTRRVENQLVETPLQVRTYGTNGELKWSRPVRDTTFRGPFPP